VKYAFIQEHREEWPVEVQCEVLGVSRSGFYDWRGRGPSPRAVRRQELAGKIREIHGEHKGRYGSPRIYEALVQGGEGVSLNTVASVMRAQGLRGKRRRGFVPTTTDSRHDSPIAENLLDRNFAAGAPDTRWACDITYVPTGQGWLYVAAVMDLCSRRIVGWKMAEHMRAELCVGALEMALAHRRPGEGLVCHSDRGVQYASEEYREALEGGGLVASMSRSGDCYDNAAMESFWATLKTELVNDENYETREQAMGSIFEYIEVYYNRKRTHSALGYKSPVAFEAGLN
jgi:transposase InsO family protein